MIAALAALTLLAPALDLPPEIQVPAVASAPAVRVDPPAPPSTGVLPEGSGSSASVDGRCVGWNDLLIRYSPGWDVDRMSRIMYRESRCVAEARNRRSGSTGLLQLMPMHCAWLDDALGEPCTVARLQDPQYNIRAAAALWRRQGYQAWAL